AVIHVYSLGYMQDDPGKSRYFASLSFFMFSMLGVVVANNFVMMFIFWELVGVSSYLLIGHWFERDKAAEAAKKAFLTNRIGDFVDRNDHRAHGRAHRDATKRHQTHPRLLDAFAARLHDHGHRARVGTGGDVPSLHPRILQSAPLSRGRLDHRDAPPRAEYLE